MIVWSFVKCAHGGCPENWRIQKKWTKLVCPCNISYGMQMKEMICFTGYLLRPNHGCITMNSNQTIIKCNENIPVHLPPKFKVMLTVFWDCQGVLLAHFQKHGDNVNSASYCEVLLKLRDSIRKKRPGHLARGVLLHHDNARLHTAQPIEERIQEPQCKFLQHPPCSPDLGPSDFRLFGSPKKHLGYKGFTDGDEVETEVR
jgi:hypothetical protein